MLTSFRDACLAVSGNNDIVDEAGKWRDATDEEGSHGTPVGSKFGRVAVHAVEVVHIWNRHIAASDDIITVAGEQRISGYEIGSGVCVGMIGTHSVIRIDVMGPKKMV